MNLFNYLMAKKGHNTSVREDLFAYLLGKRTPKEVKTVTGTTISISDATREKIVSLTLSKESTQDGTPTPDNPVEVKTVTGYRNLFDKDNALIGYEINGSDGTVSLNNGYYTSDFIPVKANENYYLQKEINIEGASNCFYDINYNFISTLRQNVGVITIPDNNNIAYMRFNGKIIQENVQLTKGTEELPYVPYGTNWIYTNILGKNKIGLVDGTYTSNNKNVVVSNGILHFEGDTGSTNLQYYIPLIKSSILKANKTYTFSVSAKSTDTISNYSVAVRLLTTNVAIDGNSFGNTYSGIVSKKATISATLTEDTTYKYVFIQINANLTGQNFDLYWQVEEGSTETSYDEYKNSVITLPLNDNEIAGIGTYKDELIVDKNGKCWLNKKVGKAIFDGSESGWVKASSTTMVDRYIINTNLYLNNSNSKCNYFIKGGINENLYIWFNNSGVQLGFNFASYGTTTLEQWKEWLSTHNLILYQPLATPELIDLNYTVDLTLFEGVNNISNSEDMDMTLKYY